MELSRKKIEKFNRKPYTAAILLIFMLFVTGCGNKPNPESRDDYVKGIQEWRQKRLERLKTPDSWLSLAGLYWLEPGGNTFGTDEKNDFVVHKEGLPGCIGTFFLNDGTVSFRACSGADVSQGSRMVSEIQMDDDSGGYPTVLRLKSLSWYIIRRGDRLGVRLKDSQHPRIHQLRKIDAFPIDQAWRIRARLEKFQEPRTIDVPTVLGTIESQPCPGALVFQVHDRTYRLYPTAEDGNLFVVFGDETNTRETYGGGRFLLIEKPDQNGEAWLDFNMAVNPPCVFSPYATCPLPPESNRLPLRVTAGEKMVRGLGH